MSARPGSGRTARPGGTDPAALRDLSDEPGRFRTTIDMARYRFGEGQCRYFDHPLPRLVTRLRTAAYGVSTVLSGTRHTLGQVPRQ